MPYWYWGSCNRSYDPQNCVSFATDSFQKHGLSVWVPPGGGYATFAGNTGSSVIVQVACAPQIGGSQVAVSAFSEDDNLAKTTQSNVLSDVQSAMAIN